MSRLFTVGDPTSIAVSVAWAQNRPLPSDVASRVVISKDVIPAITEAARLFRATDTLEDYLVQGPVVKLERDDGQSIGRVTIYAPIEDMLRKVVVTLSIDDYNKATEAHSRYQAVKLRGNVKKQGRSYVVSDPVGFDFSADVDDLDN